MKSRLTVFQNTVIDCLKNGWSIRTYPFVIGAFISKGDKEFRINNKLLFKLIRDGYVQINTATVTDKCLRTQTVDVQKELLSVAPRVKYGSSVLLFVPKRL